MSLRAQLTLWCVLVMALIVWCFAAAGSRVSATGGLYAYVEIAFGGFAGFICGTLYWVAALAAVAEANPQVVLLDIGMPGMDGYEVARRIRQSHQHSDVRLIALTGWGQSEDLRRSHEASGISSRKGAVSTVEAPLSRLLKAAFSRQRYCSGRTCDM